MKLSTAALAALSSPELDSNVVTPEDYAVAASILREFAEIAASELPDLPALARNRSKADALSAWKLARFLDTRGAAILTRRMRAVT